VLRPSGRLLEHAIDAAPRDAEVLRDRRRAHRRSQAPDLCRVDTGWPPSVLAFGLGLGLGDAFALPLERDLAFPGTLALTG
jgi:hypothetical protein